jgi:hypothetical protein
MKAERTGRGRWKSLYMAENVTAAESAKMRVVTQPVIRELTRLSGSVLTDETAERETVNRAERTRVAPIAYRITLRNVFPVTELLPGAAAPPPTRPPD